MVQKYGGSSLSSPERIKAVAERIVGGKKKGEKVVAVVSAMADTTDKLLKLAHQINPCPPKRELDLLLSSGEMVSCAVLTMALNRLGESAIAFSGPQVRIITDEAHTRARIQRIETRRVLEKLGEGKIVVVAGYQGATLKNDITTLGRGGSDITAVALAAALKADLCEIYSDVEGVYTADPQIVPQARKLSRISYEEMLELASVGAQVVHLRAVEVAKKYGVRLHIRSSFSQKKGTIID